MNKRMVKISVIVPVYQVEEYISRCLQSITKQTFKDIEIICLCDKSDSSYPILQEWGKRDSRIYLIEKQNTGVSAARNVGITIATGKYIAFVDADDWIEKHALEVLYKVAEENCADIVSYGMWPNIEPHGAKRAMFGYFPKHNAKYVGKCLKALFYEHGSRPYIGNKFYNKKFLQDNHIMFDEDMAIGEDQLLQFEAFWKAHTVCYIREKLYHYDISRSNSAMNQCEQGQAVLKANMFLLNKILRWKEKNIDKEYDVDFIWWILQDFAGWIIECQAESKESVAYILYQELQMLDVDNHIGRLPPVYNKIYQTVKAYARGIEIDNNYTLDSRIVDGYMLSNIEEIRKNIVVHESVIQRLKEAWDFHEIRHFVVRVLVKFRIWK